MNPLATPAEVLSSAADWLAEEPARWTRDFFLAPDGCRCALGAVCQVIDPADLDGDPTQLANLEKSILGELVTNVLADFLADHHDVTPVIDKGDPAEAAVETVANWNDDPERVVDEVIAALRAAAAEWTERAARRAA